jgi:hypothetical protein
VANRKQLLICLNLQNSITLQDVNTDDEEKFWTDVDSSLRQFSAQTFEAYTTIKSGSEFRHAFKKFERVVIFVDEFDRLYNAMPEVRNSVLNNFRTIRHAIENQTSSIHTVVAVGTFGILHLNVDHVYDSPFNVWDPVQNPDLTEKQVHQLFEEFAGDRQVTICPDVIKDVYWQTNGYVLQDRFAT